MEPILYVETGFLIGIAKGQDPEAAAHLKGGSPDVRLVIPSICCMESLSVWEREQKLKLQFVEALSFQIREAGRDLTSSRAKPLVTHLEQSRLGSEHLLAEIKVRLNEAIKRASEDAEFIGLEADIISESVNNEYIVDPTDNLILCSILWHARRQPGIPKALLSGNYKDFEQALVLNLLHVADVKYFKKTAAALGWLRAQRSP